MTVYKRYGIEVGQRYARAASAAYAAPNARSRQRDTLISLISSAPMGETK